MLVLIRTMALAMAKGDDAINAQFVETPAHRRQLHAKAEVACCVRIHQPASPHSRETARRRTSENVTQLMGVCNMWADLV